MIERFLLSVAVVALPQTDTVVIQADGPGEWGQVELVEHLEIGALDGPEEFAFDRVTAVGIGLDSVVYIADGGIPGVRRYSWTGRYLGDVGRTGAGPGEYKQIWGMNVLPDGRIAVWDPANARVSLFSPDASFIDSFPVGTGSWLVNSLHADGLGRLYVKTSLRGPEYAYGQQGWLRFSLQGELLDTVPIPVDESEGTFMLSTSDGPREPFPIRTLSALSFEGEPVWAKNDEYSIFEQRSNGSVLEIRRPFTPIRVNDAERRQWEDFGEYMKEHASPTGPPVMVGSVPREKPPFRGLRTDADGRIWVSLYTEAYEADLSEENLAEREGRPLYRWRELSEWEVFASDGKLLGRVTLPKRHRFIGAHGKTLIALRTGEWNEAYVVLFEMRTADGQGRVPS